MHMSNCVFCKIVNKEMETPILYEDDKLVVFNNINPSAPVHILIVPKKHVESIKKVEEEDRDLLGEMILRASKIASEKNLEGYKLIFNVGRKGGQEIDHIHLHLIGGWDNS